MIRLLVCGSRHWADIEIIRRELSRYPPGTVVIHGDNGYDAGDRMLFSRPDAEAVRGADKLAGAVAAELGLEVLRFPAEWKRYGGSAGPRRNTQMLREGQPTEALTFHPDAEPAGGTGDMVRKARAAGLPVRVVSR